jgi:hypothetical protein
MKFERCTVTALKNNEDGNGIELKILVPYFVLKDDIDEKEKETAQKLLQSTNFAITRLHLGYCDINQLIDSSEVETPKEQQTT